jgi:nitric oxide dioxygenase
VFNDEVKGAMAEAYFFLADIFIAKEEAMMKDKELFEAGWRGFRQLKLTRKVSETAIHTSFYFSPADGEPLPIFKPGQYVCIKLQPTGRWGQDD